MLRNSRLLVILTTDSLAIAPSLRHSVDMPETPTKAPVLDDVSKAIIEQLQQDGRRSYGSIGKAVGLSEAAVRQRVQRLLDAGVMQIVAVTDPLQVGFPREAMLGITVTGDIEKAAQELESLAEVNYLVICAGGFDILAEVLAEDDDHFSTVINDQIRSPPPALRAAAFFYFKFRNEIYTWGTR